MPKTKSPKLAINLDLLKPQSNPEKIPVKLLRWLLSSGRFIFIFVEALVLLAFVARFKLDGDLQSRKEAIEQQIPYIESLKPFEIIIRETQLKLSTISTFRKTYADYTQILKTIADQTPAGVKILSLNLEKSVSIITIHLSAQGQNNNDVALFLNGLRQDQHFSDVSITGVSLEKGSLNFSLTAQAKLSQGGKNL